MQYQSSRPQDPPVIGTEGEKTVREQLIWIDHFMASLLVIYIVYFQAISVIEYWSLQPVRSPEKIISLIFTMEMETNSVYFAGSISSLCTSILEQPYPALRRSLLHSESCL